MLLKASKRGGHRQLGHHLLNTSDNEHVDVHEIKGLMAATLMGALQEMYGVSKGTQCEQFLFSVSLNPPAAEKAPPEYFEQAIEKIEQRCGLVGQPRVVVFHEKHGRRHCHVVWSRIDIEAMKAIQQPFFKQRLHDLSRSLFLEQGWPLPDGYFDHNRRDPLNFTLEEWQQAKRMEENPKMLKAMIQDAWNQSADKEQFAEKLKQHGFWLARGDRRGYVVVDYKQGDVLSLSRWSGIKAKELQVKLGEPAQLPSIDEVKADIAAAMTKQMQRYAKEVKAKAKQEMAPLRQAAKTMTDQHKQERINLKRKQADCRQLEQSQRQERLPIGLRGVFAKLTGKYKAIQQENAQHYADCQQRDRAERQAMIDSQLQQRQRLQEKINVVKERYGQQLQELRQDFNAYQSKGDDGQKEAYLRQRLADMSTQQSQQAKRKTHNLTLDGPSL